MERTTSRKPGRPHIKDIVLEILRLEGKPMNVSEITNAVLQKRPLASKEPEKTVYSILYRGKEFKRVGTATFTLADETE